MVDLLTRLRSDTATRNATASRYLEAAIAYWSAGVGGDSELEHYALDRVTWAAVLRSRATEAAEFAAFRRAGCDLWRLQGYSNAEERCAKADEAERDAEESDATATAREEVDSFIAGIGDTGSTREALEALTDRWNATINTARRPSESLAAIGREGRQLAQVTVNRLTLLRSHPAIRNETLNPYLEALIGYWSATVALYEELEDYALDRVAWDSVAAAQNARNDANTELTASINNLEIP